MKRSKRSSLYVPNYQMIIPFNSFTRRLNNGMVSNYKRMYFGRHRRVNFNFKRKR